jgi:signal transduction histidine kinase
LSLIRGYAETLRDVTGGSPAKRTQQLDIIVAETERLSAMVDDILDLSQLQSGGLQLNPDCFLIKEFIYRIAQRYEVLSQQRGIPLQLQISEDTMVKADEARIEQVLYNLLSNAFNHVENDGHISIRAIPENNWLRLEVINTGPGIPLEDLPHIWDRYYKSSVRMKGYSGTGLGLAIVKAVLEAHGAPFGVDQSNGATTFWFDLALCQPA